MTKQIFEVYYQVIGKQEEELLLIDDLQTVEDIERIYNQKEKLIAYKSETSWVWIPNVTSFRIQKSTIE